MTEQPVVVVRGDATREVPPEQAVLSITTSAKDPSRETVLARLTERTGLLRSVLDEFADAIEKRETSQVYVYPQFRRRGGTEHAVAYHGRAETSVTVSDFAALGLLLPRLARIDQIELAGPWWRLRPGSSANAEVRQAAIADALANARAYAAAVGARIDRLVEISDEVHGGGHESRMFAMAAGAADEGTLLELDPQMQTVRASVVVRLTITEPDLGISS